MKILDILKITEKEKEDGIWVSGREWDGEYKVWWWDDGNLWEHSFWKKGNIHGVYKEWNVKGDLDIHELWDKGKLIKDLLNE